MSYTCRICFNSSIERVGKLIFLTGTYYFTGTIAVTMWPSVCCVHLYRKRVLRDGSGDGGARCSKSVSDRVSFAFKPFEKRHARTFGAGRYYGSTEQEVMQSCRGHGGRWKKNKNGFLPLRPRTRGNCRPSEAKQTYARTGLKNILTKHTGAGETGDGR